MNRGIDSTDYLYDHEEVLDSPIYPTNAELYDEFCVDDYFSVDEFMMYLARQIEYRKEAQEQMEEMHDPADQEKLVDELYTEIQDSRLIPSKVSELVTRISTHLVNGEITEEQNNNLMFHLHTILRTPEQKYEDDKNHYITRYGKPYHEDRNHTLYFADYTCKRCGGQGGLDQWAYTGWTCYECGGSGKAYKPEIIKLYTPEYAKKLEARRKKAEEKKQAEHGAKIDQIRKDWLIKEGFSEDGFTFVFLGDTYKIKEQLKELGAKFDYVLNWHIAHDVEGFETVKISKDDILSESYNGYCYKEDVANIIKNMKSKKVRELHPELHKSEYQGKVKERFKDLKLECLMNTKIEGASYSYHDDGTRYLYSFKDEAGNIFTWIASSHGSHLHLQGSNTSKNVKMVIKSLIISNTFRKVQLLFWMEQ